MRPKIIRIMVAFLALTMVWNLALFSQDKTKTPPKTQTIGIDFSAALNFSYNRIDVELGSDDLPASMEYSYLALQIDFTLLDFLTAGVVAGYNSNTFKDPVNFFRLPLTLQSEGTRFNSMMFGVRAIADLFSWKDFSFTVNGEALIFKRFEKELPIELNAAAGTALLENNFRQLGLEFLVHYEGLDYITIFAGPQLHLLSGTFSATEKIENIDAMEELEYRQKSTLGLRAGVYYELSSHFDIKASISLLSKISLSVTVFYIF